MGSEEHAQEIMDEIDINGDGEISFEEFVVMMQKKGLGEDNTPRGDQTSGGFDFVDEKTEVKSKKTTDL